MQEVEWWDSGWRWREQTGAELVARPNFIANGMVFDRAGDLLVCEHVTSSVVRVKRNGDRQIVAYHYQGRYLNSPNDVVTRSDGTIYFTDPDYGRWNDWIGCKREFVREANGVYRVPPGDGDAELVCKPDEFDKPNGLCFSPDETLLYIVESRGVPNRKILAYDVTDGGRKLANKRVLIDAGPGTPDGMRCDVDGNLWCGWGMGSPDLDGVMVFNRDGKPIGRIALPERCANVCFGGLKRNRLFMAASQSMYALYINGQGAPGG